MVLPRRVGSFTLMRKLDTDGLTEAYAGILEDPPGRQIVARRLLPVVTRELDRLPEVVERVGDLAQIHHPSLASVFDLVEADGEHYVTEEWVEGISLAGIIRACASQNIVLPQDLFLHLATQLCNALEALHSRPGAVSGSESVLHAALNPRCVWVTAEGRVVIGRYGLTASPTVLTSSSSAPLPATVAYLAPEQTHQDPKLGPAADIFALGAVLYELLTLRSLFRAETSLQTIHRIRRAEVSTPLLEVKDRMPGLDKLLYRAMSLNPRHRYQRAFVLREDLRGLMAGYTFADIDAKARQFIARLTDPSPSLEDHPSPAGTTADRRTSWADQATSPDWHDDGGADSTASLLADLAAVGAGAPPRRPAEPAHAVDDFAGARRPPADSLPRLNPDFSSTRDRDREDTAALLEASGSFMRPPLTEPLPTEPLAERAGADPQGGPTLPRVPDGEDLITASSMPFPLRVDRTIPIHNPPRETSRGGSEPTRKLPADDPTVAQSPRERSGLSGVSAAPFQPKSGTLPPPFEAARLPPLDDEPPPPSVETVPAYGDQPPLEELLEDEEVAGRPPYGLYVLLVLAAVIPLACAGAGALLALRLSLGPPAWPPAEVAAPAPHPAPLAQPPAAPPVESPAAQPGEPLDRPSPAASASVPLPLPEPIAPPPPAPARETWEAMQALSPPPAPRPASVEPSPPPRPEPRARPVPEPIADVEEVPSVAALTVEPEAAPGPPASGGIDRWSDPAFRGELPKEAIGELRKVAQSDPDFTRARTLLYLDATARGDQLARKEHLAAALTLPENQYNPVLLVETASIELTERQWDLALAHARTAEQHWARLPSDLVFTRKAAIYEIQALAETGLFYASEGADRGHLNRAILGWERYRRHVLTKSRTDLAANADTRLALLREIEQRME